MADKKPSTKPKNTSVKTSKKTTAPDTAPAVIHPHANEEAVDTRPETKSAQWRPGSAFWGLAVILVGLLILLDNLGIADFQLWNLATLWPLIIIGVGISLLSPKSWPGKVLVALVILASLGTILYVATQPEANRQIGQTQSNITPADDVTQAEVEVNTGAGEVKLSTDSLTPVADATLRSDIFELKHSSQVRGNTQHVEFSTFGKGNWQLGTAKNELDVKLGRNLPTSLKIDAGASSITGDLSDKQPRRLEIKAGASEIDLTLGASDEESEVELDVGASTVRLRIPQDAGVRVITDDGLTTKDFDNINETEEGRYESPEYDKAPRKIVIRAKLGVSTFTIDRY